MYLAGIFGSYCTLKVVEHCFGAFVVDILFDQATQNSELGKRWEVDHVGHVSIVWSEIAVYLKPELCGKIVERGWHSG
jgi:hypothetical protein